MSGWSKAFRLKLKEFKRERLENLRRVVAIIFICACSIGAMIPPVSRLDLWVMQGFYKVRGALPTPDDVVIAALDDESYMQLQASVRWPFPRKYSAETIERIVRAEPKILIMDFAIPLEDHDPEANARLERAIAAGKVTMVSGLHATGSADEVAKNPAANTFTMPSDPRFEKAAKLLLEMWVSQSMGMVSRIALNGLPDAPLRQRAPLAFALNELAGYRIPAPGPTDLIKYYGRKGSFARVPFFEILRADDEALKRKFGGKIVLAGLHSIEQGRDKMKDEFDVPIGGTMFGVEIHATIAGNLIKNEWLRRMRIDDELSIVLIGSLVFALAGVFLSFRACLAASAALVAGVTIASYQAFARYDMWLPFVPSVAILALCTVAANQTIRYFSAEKKVQQSKDFWDFETQDS